MNVAGGTRGAPPRCVRPREIENLAYDGRTIAVTLAFVK